jgi:hypothetical protein
MAFEFPNLLSNFLSSSHAKPTGAKPTHRLQRSSRPEPAAGLESTHHPSDAGKSDISPDIRRLCSGLNGKLGKVASTWATLTGNAEPRPQVEEVLDKEFADGSVTRQCFSGSDLHKALEAHHGPVILLNPHGMPEFVFERRNGEWKGYNAFSFEPLPAGSSPAKSLAAQFKSHHGLYFSAFSIKGWSGRPGSTRAKEEEELLVVQPRISSDRDSEKRPLLVHDRGDSSDDTSSVSSDTSSVYGSDDAASEWGTYHRLRSWS